MRVCGCVGVCAETSYAFSVCLWIRSTAANKPQGTGNTSHAPNHTHTHHTLKGRVLHGLRKGSMSFLRTVTLETVHTSQKVTRPSNSLTRRRLSVVSDAQSTVLVRKNETYMGKT